MDTKLFLSACAAALIAAGQAFQSFAEDAGNDAPAAPKKRTTSASATDASDDAPEPKASSRKKPSPPSDDGEGPDYETDVRPKVVALSKDYGRDTALEVLAKFTNPATDEPCTKGQEVDPADYPKLLKAIKVKIAELAED